MPDKDNFFYGIEAQSFIRLNSVTTTSVEIFLPTNKQFLTIRAEQLEKYGKEPDTKIRTLLSVRSIYRIDELKPGTTYRICVRSAKSDKEWDIPHPGFEDVLLCGNVTTQIAGFPSENEDSFSDNTINNNVNAGHTENQIHKNGDELKNAAENNSSKLLFPVVASCTGLCIIAGIVAFFCYRKTKRYSRGNDATESISEYRSEKVKYASEDVMPMMRQHCDYTLMPKSFSGESTASTHLSDDVYQLSLPQHDAFPHQQQNSSSRVSCKNADYRKCGHGKFSQKNALEALRYCDKSALSPEAVQLNKGTPVEDFHRLNNSRQEYISEPKYVALQTNFSCGLGRDTYNVPESSQKYFNEQYHGSDVKDCGYLVGSTDQVHNSLKLHSSYRDFVPAQLSHSLRLNSEHKAHRNERQQIERLNLNAGSVQQHRVFAPIKPGHETMEV